MKTKRTWILLADGARARIIREPEVSLGGKHLEDIAFETDHKPLREIMADRPGRAFESAGSRRSSMEYHSDPEREQEQAFASRLADELSRRYSASEFDALAIVAPPRMLGMIRSALPEPIRACVAAEISKDLTKLPAAKLQKAILALGIPGVRGIDG